MGCEEAFGTCPSLSLHVRSYDRRCNCWCGRFPDMSVGRSRDHLLLSPHLRPQPPVHHIRRSHSQHAGIHILAIVFFLMLITLGLDSTQVNGREIQPWGGGRSGKVKAEEEAEAAAAIPPVLATQAMLSSASWCHSPCSLGHLLPCS